MRAECLRASSLARIDGVDAPVRWTARRGVRIRASPSALSPWVPTAPPSPKRSEVPVRSRPLLALAAAVALALAACGGAGDDAAPDTSPATDDAAGAELGEGVAAVVNGTEIPTEVVDARAATAAAAPEVAAILEGEDGEAAQAQLQASILSQLIVNEIVVDGAEARGLTIDEDAIEETRDELTTQAGGAEAFAEQVDQAGLDETQLMAELAAVTALRLVRDDLSAEADGTPPPVQPAPDGSTPDPADALLQQWLLGQLQEADVTVEPSIGSWDPTRGTVVPAGATAPPAGPPAPPASEPTAPADAPAPTATED